MNTKQQGDIGVAHAIYHYTLAGHAVSIPNTDNTRYDLIVDKSGVLYRVQCKTTGQRTPQGRYRVEFRTRGGNQSWNGESKLITGEETDLVWVTTLDREGYEFPAEVVSGIANLTLNDSCDQYRV